MEVKYKTENSTFTVLIQNMLSTRGKLKNLGLSINGDCPLCYKQGENIDHIFKSCDLTINSWHTLSNNCPTLVNTNLGIVD